MELLEVAQAGVASPGEAVAAVAAADDVNLRGGSGNTPLLWASYFNEKYLVQVSGDTNEHQSDTTGSTLWLSYTFDHEASSALLFLLLT